MVRLYELGLRLFFTLLLVGGIAIFSLEYAGIHVDDCPHDPLTHAVAGDECHCLGQLLHSPFLEEKSIEVRPVPFLVGHVTLSNPVYHSAAPGDIPVPPA